MPTLRSPRVCLIAVDTFERRSGVVEALRGLGATTQVRHLPVGDYDLGRSVLVERKTVADLHLSLERGRLWKQLGELRLAARLPYLLLEGRDLDNGSIEPNAIRGAILAVVGQGIPILPAGDARDSARWLVLLALRASGLRPSRDRPVYAQRLKPRREQAAEGMLAAVPGISVDSARRLLTHFGSVSEVIRAGQEEWLSVAGIGPARAKALRDAVS